MKKIFVSSLIVLGALAGATGCGMKPAEVEAKIAQKVSAAIDSVKTADEADCLKRIEEERTAAQTALQTLRDSVATAKTSKGVAATTKPAAAKPAAKPTTAPATPPPTSTTAPATPPAPKKVDVTKRPGAK
ncbi:MAG: hypothetical protein IPL35_03920 [Sphingobacteriales bacterium]|nr:hypothetical protein [Sphingobacteriales bacterium]